MNADILSLFSKSLWQFYSLKKDTKMVSWYLGSRLYTSYICVDVYSPTPLHPAAKIPISFK